VSLSTQVSEIKTDEIVCIAKSVINTVSKEDLGDEDKQKLSRLSFLVSELDPPSLGRKIIATGMKLLSFATGAAAGIAVTITGQDSFPSYWLTLIASATDSIVGGINTVPRKGSISEKYIAICETVHICEDLLRLALRL
jgi:hypothetical protein